MPLSPGSRIPATSIPSITVLRQELDYGNPKEPRCSAFYDDIRAFRKKYHSSAGMRGLDLHDWKSEKHQAGLNEMTEAYLEKHGNGALFWPDSESAPNFNTWQYSKDREYIRNHIKRLFFRLNLQQDRNHRYKNKVKLEPIEFDERGRSAEDAIEINSAENSPIIPAFDPDPNPWTSTAIPSREAPRNSSNGSSQAHNLKRPAVSGDAYDVPDEPSTTMPRPDSRGAPVSPAGNRGKRLKSLRSPTDPPRPSASNGASAAFLSTGKASLSGAAATMRKSPRKTKKARQGDELIDYTIDRSFDEYLKSPTPGTPTPSVEQSTGFARQEPPLPDQDVHAQNSRPQTNTHPLPVPDHGPLPSAQGQKTDYMTPVPEPPRPAPIPTPSATISDGFRESHQTSERRDLPKPPVQSVRANIEFVYHVILSRRPLSAKRWSPTRKLEEMSLGDFMGELQFPTDVSGLVILADGPGLKTVEEIRRGDEAGFDSWRRLLKRGIRGELASRAPGDTSPLVFDIEIEPMNPDGAGRDQELEVEDFII